MLPGHGWHRPLYPHRLRHAAEPQQVRQELSPFLPFHLILWFPATQSALTTQHSCVAQPAAEGLVLLRGFSDACRSINLAGSVLSLFRITAAVEKVELLWQQAFSKAKFQLRRFQLWEEALQVSQRTPVRDIEHVK